MTRTRGLLSGVFFTLIFSVAFADITLPQNVKIDNLKIAQSLTGAPGDPIEGRKTFANRKLGNCLACHANSDLAEQLFHGEVGPELDGVASRRSPEQMRAIIVNAKAVFIDGTIMPAFYSLNVGKNVSKDFVGKTILTPEQVEDVVAYLSTLK